MDLKYFLRRNGGPAMKRRNFLASVAVPVAAAAQQPVPGGRTEAPAEPVAGPKPAVALSHVGFLPNARKTLIYRVTGSSAPNEFTIRELGYPLKNFQVSIPLRKVAGDLGDHMVGDFSSLDHEGLFVATAGGERSVPFFVRKDAWRRTLPIALSYHHAQRCGVAIPNVHPACHLDDALRRDNGQHVDMTGGWHDAGDVLEESAWQAGGGIRTLSRIKTKSREYRDISSSICSLPWHPDEAVGA
jgi:hypothetical protein